jgi:hypothetical protein
MAARDSTELVELVFTVELVVALAQACTCVVSVSVLAALELAYTVVVSAAVLVSVSVGQEQELASERAWTASGTVTVALALALAALPALVLQERQALGLEALLVSVAMSAAMLASVVEWAGLPAQAWVGTPVLAATWAETRAVAVV